MTLSTQDLLYSDAVMKAPRTADQNQKAPESFPLLRLPLELRRQIYLEYLVVFRSPTPETIYLGRKPLRFKDPPSPLLLVSSQIHAEVLDTIKTKAISLRVTHHGIQFDTYAETCFIAQRQSRDYASISHLVITIWPPHPDRPTDLIAIWRHLRKLRRELRDVPSLQKVSFLFENNEMAGWTHKGKALDLMHPREDDESPFNDLTCIMDLFSRVRAAQATWYLPFGLRRSETTDYIRSWRNHYQAMMMGRIPVDEDAYSEEDEEDSSLQDYIDETTEWNLRQGTGIARGKLDAVTRLSRRMSWGEWKRRVGYKEYEGMDHYIHTSRSLESLDACR
ncbi:MAG: hypothetical protein Q9161_004755 [Pseudevernia consocians]